MFIAYLEQKNCGCDYSIGCGSILVTLSSSSKREAIKELEKIILGEYSEGERNEGYWEEFELESACLYEVSSEDNVPLADWYAKAIEDDKLQKEKEIKEKEYAEYQRLQVKFKKE